MTRFNGLGVRVLGIRVRESTPACESHGLYHLIHMDKATHARTVLRVEAGSYRFATK